MSKTKRNNKRDKDILCMSDDDDEDFQIKSSKKHSNSNKRAKPDLNEAVVNTKPTDMPSEKVEKKDDSIVKSTTEDTVKSNESNDAITVESGNNTQDTVILEENLVEEKQLDKAPVKEKPVKKQSPPKPKKEKKKKIDSESEDDYSENGSDSDFEVKKSKKAINKKTPAKKPNKDTKKNEVEPAKPVETVIKPIEIVPTNEAKKSEENPIIITPKTEDKENKPSDNKKKEVKKKDTKIVKKTDNDSKEQKSEEPAMKKPEQPFKAVKATNASVTNSPLTQLGRIEIRSPGVHRVGLSRNSKCKPLHPNVKLDAK